MENPARTAEYLARSAARRVALRARLSDLLATRPSNTPFVLEIGAGHGHFLTDYAAAHRDEFCIGIDLIAERIARAQRKQQRARLDNLVFVQAEALEFLDALPPATALTRIFVLFPDPWPKRRHHKNRLIQTESLHALAKYAKIGAELCFRTDDADYFAAARATVSQHPAWNLIDTPWPFERETVFQSRAASYHSWMARYSPARP